MVRVIISGIGQDDPVGTKFINNPGQFVFKVDSRIGCPSIEGARVADRAEPVCGEVKGVSRDQWSFRRSSIPPSGNPRKMISSDGCPARTLPVMPLRGVACRIR